MTLLEIDQTKCKKDGICVAECPATIIGMEGDGFPEMVPGGDDICIVCGHCVAVCPNGALSHKGLSLKDCPPVNKELVISEAQVVQFLRSRRSIRVYKDQPVEKEKIQRLIEIARYAPTGSNTQMVEWIVFGDREKAKHLAGLTAEWIRSVVESNPENPPYPIERLKMFLAGWDAGVDTILRGAPTVIIASSPEDVGNQMVDLTNMLNYLDLAAPTMGLGTCWAGLLVRALRNSAPLREAAGLPEKYPFYYPMMVGYPKFQYNRLPGRKQPKITWR